MNKTGVVMIRLNSKCEMRNPFKTSDKRRSDRWKPVIRNSNDEGLDEMYELLPWDIMGHDRIGAMDNNLLLLNSIATLNNEIIKLRKEMLELKKLSRK